MRIPNSTGEAGLSRRDYHMFKRAIAANYQETTERLGKLNRIPPEERSEITKALISSLKERLTCVHRRPAQKVSANPDNEMPASAGLLRTLWEMCTETKRGSFSIQSMK